MNVDICIIHSPSAVEQRVKPQGLMDNNLHRAVLLQILCHAIQKCNVWFQNIIQTSARSLNESKAWAAGFGQKS